jgi:GntR family transcriptional regulator of vanillate catabolism
MQAPGSLPGDCIGIMAGELTVAEKPHQDRFGRYLASRDHRWFHPDIAGRDPTRLLCRSLDTFGESQSLPELHTSTELATERLREAILTGELPAGEKLHQDRLAEMLGISRTPLRTALTSLAQTGLVSYATNRGFYVREFSFSDVTSAFVVRAELEALACRLAAPNMTDETRALLFDLVAEGDRLLAPGELLAENLADYRRMNVTFHSTVIALSCNPWIATFVGSLHNVPAASDRVIMWRDFPVIHRSHDDHHRIARSLANGDGERAAAIMHEHITFAREHLRSQFELYPDDFLRMPAAEKAPKARRATRKRKS